jgi:hypothetical protein
MPTRKKKEYKGPKQNTKHTKQKTKTKNNTKPKINK